MIKQSITAIALAIALIESASAASFTVIPSGNGQIAWPFATPSLLAASSVTAKENCVWKWGWPAISACQCRNLGYRQGTPEFLQCFQIVMEQNNQIIKSLNDAGQRLRPPRPLLNCDTTGYGFNSTHTTCY
jgi:hypothetical protein